ncbi:FMN-binding negative transcriptional regulator [Kineococcus arenarius]|uniref:FMN-binding negative transcriptional regulator n=1 Tax=unclassified Kineococcus TaxID=2621656 RepID=UPI003D7DC126
MHEFPAYPAPDEASSVDLVRSHPFALVVSGGADGPAPVATHTPVVLDPDAAAPAALVGTVLLGHLARSNPQWRSLTPDARVLLVFSGPHDYVSPTAYGTDPAVPTWDYAAVHLTARVEVVDEAAGCLEIVRKTVAALEAREPEPWDMTSSLPVFERIVGGVVGLRLHVETRSAVFKLSQDVPADVRRRVAAASRARGCPYGDVASLVERCSPAGEAS